MEGIIQSPTTPKQSGSFFTPLLISMAGIVSTSIIIVLYHLVLVKYCQRRRHRNSTSRASRRRGPVSESQMAVGAGANGVEKKILEAIPILSYSTKKDSLMFRVDQSECVVCLGELEDGDVVRLLPSCRHVFHVSCIDEWFSGHTSCPICRSPIVAPTTPPFSSSMLIPLDVGNGDGDRRVDILPRQVSYHQGGDGDGDGDGGGSTSRVQSSVLRHCVSMVLPMEEKPRRLIMGLKRSLSMDQSFVLVNRQRETQRNLSSSSSCSSSSSSSSLSSSSSSILKGAMSVSQLDRVSSMLARSFSLLRMGSRSSTNNGILPY